MRHQKTKKKNQRFLKTTVFLFSLIPLLFACNPNTDDIIPVNREDIYFAAGPDFDVTDFGPVWQGVATSQGCWLIDVVKHDIYAEDFWFESVPLEDRVLVGSNANCGIKDI